MEKMSLHESLRIYIPGLLFTLLMHILLTKGVDNTGSAAVMAIFVGFALSYPFNLVARIFFAKIVRDHQIQMAACRGDFHSHHHRILASKAATFLSNHTLSESVVDGKLKNWHFVAYSHFSKNYDSPVTASFRVPKSLGVMCFNLALASLTAPALFLIISIVMQLNVTGWHWLVISVCIVFSVLFVLSATNFLKSSLEKELYYWASLSKEEVENLVHLSELANGLREDQQQG